MKKKSLLVLVGLIILVLIILSIKTCGVDDDERPPIPPDTTKVVIPLNLSVYLDLSDRIKPDGSDQLAQKDKDIAIVQNLANFIKDRAVAQKILPSKERMKIFFYPEPKDGKVAMLSEKLELDLANTEPSEKKKRLKEFEEEFKDCLEQIYNSTIQTSSWVGSDIWGFFNKPIDNYCIKDGYRNVLVVLTDGYIYHVSNKCDEGNAHSYILPQTLRDPNSSLIVKRKGLNNLEVLMLELNPNPPTDQSKMEQVITDWLNAMEVKKSYVGETDVPSNTKMIIENFLNKK